MGLYRVIVGRASNKDLKSWRVRAGKGEGEGDRGRGR